jgi:hypothetical protein
MGRKFSVDGGYSTIYYDIRKHNSVIILDNVNKTARNSKDRRHLVTKLNHLRAAGKSTALCYITLVETFV